VKRGELTGRFDVNFWRLTPLFHETFGKPVYAPSPIGSLVSLVQYGSSSLASEEPIGVPMLRMNNLQDDGWDLSELKYIALGETELGRYRLLQGDILFNRTNSKELVGKCAVFNEPGDWVFASYLIRVRLESKLILPQFAADFLNAPAGRLQIDRLSRQIIGMTNINAEEIKEILLPVPPMPVQRELLAAMDKARETRRANLSQAGSLLEGVDSFLLGALGLTSPAKNDRKTFAARLSDLRESRRMSADYFHPERILALRGMAESASHLDCRRLTDVVEFVRVQIKEPEANYVGLAHVQSGTGELTASDEQAGGTCFVFKTGDVLFARLRPYLNKVYRAEQDGCCSPEFHVLRVRDSRVLQPDYLATILRSSLILAQTRHMMTGNTHPRLANDDVVNLVIPIPKPDVQDAIVREVRQRRIQARQKRADAEGQWTTAKLWFEEQLLGNPPKP